MSPASPSVSVVMPVRNGMSYLEEAVDSILGQTHRDLELVAVDDGSTDGSRERLAQYAHQDERVLVVSSEGSGLVDALMTGIHRSQAPWIGRMDADDRSHPDRFRKQLAFVQEHPEVALIGSTARVIDDSGSPIRMIRYPLTDPLIRLSLRSSTTFAHGSVLVRRDVVLAAGGYRKDAFPVEDYDLWCRLARAGTVMANLDAPLYDYRLSPEGVSRTHAEAQERAAIVVGDDLARTSPCMPSARVAVAAVGAVSAMVRRGEAHPRALRRIAESCLQAGRQWGARRPRVALACAAASVRAELAYRRRQIGAEPDVWVST